MIDKIKRIIEEKDFSKFIGLKENLWFDAKRRDPYQIDLPSGKYELAKDISAFANAEGGHIIVGLIAKPLDAERSEEVTELDLMSKNEFNVEKYKILLGGYIYPKIDNLVVEWCESSEGPKGIGHFFIPPQEESKKYFLITKGIFIEGDKVKDNVVGLARRNDASNLPISGKEIHNVIKKGKNPIIPRLDNVENTLIVIDQKIGFIINELRSVEKNKIPQEANVDVGKLYDALRRITE